MRYFTVLVLAFCICVSARGQNPKPRPLDGALDNPTPAQIIFSTNSNETQYLGFNCEFLLFRRCARLYSDQPARNVLLDNANRSVFGWRLARCRRLPGPNARPDVSHRRDRSQVSAS